MERPNTDGRNDAEGPDILSSAQVQGSAFALPSDLLREVISFCRGNLPDLRCIRSVCKSWRDLTNLLLWPFEFRPPTSEIPPPNPSLPTHIQYDFYASVPSEVILLRLHHVVKMTSHTGNAMQLDLGCLHRLEHLEICDTMMDLRTIPSRITRLELANIRSIECIDLTKFAHLEYLRIWNLRGEGNGFASVRFPGRVKVTTT